MDAPGCIVRFCIVGDSSAGRVRAVVTFGKEIQLKSTLPTSEIAMTAGWRRFRSTVSAQYRCRTVSGRPTSVMLYSRHISFSTAEGTANNSAPERGSQRGVLARREKWRTVQ
jgi:hypothetical protein